MPAYVIAQYDIVDPKAYESYVAGVVPLLQKHGAELLVADRDSDAWEGRKPGVIVVLKFASEKAARDWYNDPAYGPVKQIRFNSTQNVTLALAKEFKMPPK
jgi:uncharacterized protein (DUF1330 family)